MKETSLYLAISSAVSAHISSSGTNEENLPPYRKGFQLGELISPELRQAQSTILTGNVLAEIEADALSEEDSFSDSAIVSYLMLDGYLSSAIRHGDWTPLIGALDEAIEMGKTNKDLELALTGSDQFIQTLGFMIYRNYISEETIKPSRDDEARSKIQSYYSSLWLKKGEFANQSELYQFAREFNLPLTKEDVVKFDLSG